MMFDPMIAQRNSTYGEALRGWVWPKSSLPTPNLLVSHHGSPIAAAVQAYAEYVADLLGSRLRTCPEPGKPGSVDLFKMTEPHQDLVIFGAPCQSLIRRLLLGSADVQAAMQLPTSVVIARCPRWPLKRVLLVTRGQDLDEVSVRWVIQLASPSRAVVTVLAVQPALSAPDSQALYGQGLASWLETDTPLGRQLRRVSKQVSNWEVEGKLHFRPGLPGWQIKCEVVESDPDLVIIAADPLNWWLRRLMGELVNPLLHWIDRPVLVAKPTII